VPPSVRGLASPGRYAAIVEHDSEATIMSIQTGEA
jgi:hypothetical protein